MRQRVLSENVGSDLHAKHKCCYAGRYGNPTTKACEDKIKALEGAEDALVSASGMNSVTSMLLSLVPAGGHIITTSDCYWRTRQFMQNFLPKMNIGVSVIAPNDFGALQQALDSHNAALFFSESPTNPYLRCVDIEKISKMCHAKVCVQERGPTECDHMMAHACMAPCAGCHCVY
jgi:cystathionine gamma-synthase